MFFSVTNTGAEGEAVRPSSYNSSLVQGTTEGEGVEGVLQGAMIIGEGGAGGTDIRAKVARFLQFKQCHPLHLGVGGLQGEGVTEETGGRMPPDLLCHSPHPPLHPIWAPLLGSAQTIPHPHTRVFPPQALPPPYPLLSRPPPDMATGRAGGTTTGPKVTLGTQLLEITFIVLLLFYL